MTRSMRFNLSKLTEIIRRRILTMLGLDAPRKRNKFPCGIRKACMIKSFSSLSFLTQANPRQFFKIPPFFMVFAPFLFASPVSSMRLQSEVGKRLQLEDSGNGCRLGQHHLLDVSNFHYSSSSALTFGRFWRNCLPQRHSTDIQPEQRLVLHQ